ncbi:MAG: hypothetical protein ABIJ12_06075 [bacterium]
MIKTRILSTCLLLFMVAMTLSAQQQPSQINPFSGVYIDQTIPGTTPKFFAEGFVNTPMDMHGNIVFTPDLKEAIWHPDEPKGLYISRNVEGVWSTPEEISFVSGFMHDAPCYSVDGKLLYFMAGAIGSSSKTENEKLYVVERKGDTWTGAKILDTVFDSYSMHWQFSLDSKGNLYFGGNQKGIEERSDIWYARYENNRYMTPVRLPETINSENGEFSPCIAPDESYIIFNRAVFEPEKPPVISLYISYKSPDGSWTESQSLDSVLHSKGHDLNAKISPDNKYLFFMRRLSAKSGTYWVSTSVLDGLQPFKK